MQIYVYPQPLSVAMSPCQITQFFMNNLVS